MKKPGVYKLKCIDCPQQYIGKTGRNFKMRYEEHIRDTITYGSSKQGST
jgi:hypothetical protein